MHLRLCPTSTWWAHFHTNFNTPFITCKFSLLTKRCMFITNMLFICEYEKIHQNIFSDSDVKTYLLPNEI
jgi:hypothetical protein